VTTASDGKRCIVCSSPIFPAGPVLFCPAGVLHVECYLPRLPERAILPGEGFLARQLRVARYLVGLRDRVERSNHARRSRTTSLVTASGERIRQSQTLAAAVRARVDRTRERRAALGPLVLRS